MDIYISHRQRQLSLPDEHTERIIEAVLALEKTTCDEVSLHFVESDEMRNLHNHFFNDPSPTDCISFPIDTQPDDHYRVLGEIFVCPQTAIDYVKEHGGSPLEETYLYLVHGLLHLIGYDDIDDNDFISMKEAEKRHMDNLKTLQGIPF